MATTKFTFDTAYLRILYEALHSTVMVPLDIRLPPEWLIQFVITKDDEAYGWVNPEDDFNEPFGEYTVEISKAKNTTYKDLIETLLHEMIHVHAHHLGLSDWDEHGQDSPFDKTRIRVEQFTGLSIS
jgi:hypothetical protein